jgi:glycosyltransferase involved in cell wall biosynthesis
MEIQWVNARRIGAELRRSIEARLRVLAGNQSDLAGVRIAARAKRWRARDGQEVSITAHSTGREIATTCTRSDLGRALGGAVEAFERELRGEPVRRAAKRGARRAQVAAPEPISPPKPARTPHRGRGKKAPPERLVEGAPAVRFEKARPQGTGVPVLMLGWEFPPYFAGGVGVVAEGLTRSLARRGSEVTYLMPHGPERAEHAGLHIVTPSAEGEAGATLRVASLEGALHSFSYAAGAGPAGAGPGETLAIPGERRAPSSGPLYGPGLLEEVERFAEACVRLVGKERIRFDVIHAHDWTTFRAGLALKRATGKPLLIHVHITEFDKSGGSYADPRVFTLEQEGIRGADRVVAVSRRVAERCIASYGADPARVRVVYNAVEPDLRAPEPLPLGGPVVLFLGRVTLQKGPDYFVEAARKVLDEEPDAIFVLAGSGDMLPRLIERAAELGLGSRMLFPGFVDRDRAAALYASADVFVMPSVSEPFGIVPLEAMDRGVPVIVSRQSGVGELLRNALKVDFWDVDDLAGKILAALRYPPLARELRDRGKEEVGRLSWDGVAERIEGIYREMIHA